MARVLDVLGGSGGEGPVSQISGGLFLLCMIIVSLSIVSMVIFACGTDDPDNSVSGKSHKRHGCFGFNRSGGGGDNPNKSRKPHSQGGGGGGFIFTPGLGSLGVGVSGGGTGSGGCGAADGGGGGGGCCGSGGGGGGF